MSPAPNEVLAPKATVLVVEDEDAVRMLVELVLTKNGYKVFGARDGPEALNLFALHADTIDLIVTDVVMPEMSGYELVHQLVMAKPGLKVIFMSGFTADETMPSALHSHGIRRLHKPFMPGDLTQLMEETLHPS
jgi:CheY-like chemotaxis protein